MISIKISAQDEKIFAKNGISADPSHYDGIGEFFDAILDVIDEYLFDYMRTHNDDAGLSDEGWELQKAYDRIYFNNQKR